MSGCTGMSPRPDHPGKPIVEETAIIDYIRETYPYADIRAAPAIDKESGR